LAGLERTECSGYFNENYQSYLEKPQKEITIDGKKYLKWGIFSLREENGKILVYSERQKKDLILYDFTLNLGDTLTTLILDTESDSENISVIDYPLVICSDTIMRINTLTVVNLSLITLLDGNNYKKWTFNNGRSYVEKIGNFNDFFDFSIDYVVSVSYMGDHLVCASQDGQLLYKMDDETQIQFGTKCKCLNKGASAIYYKPMVVEGYNWNVVNRNASMDDNDSVKYKTIKQKFEGDSIINDVTYKKLWQSTDNKLADYELIGLIREDAETEKVWAYVGDKEYLVYDFACSVGDKVTTLKSLQSAKNQIEEVELTIKAIEVIEDLNGTKYNKYIATLDNESEIVYYERFGSENGWYSRSYDGVTGGGVNFMVCAFDAANELLFKPVHNNELDEIENCYINVTKTDVETITAPTTTAIQKIIRDGQVFIIRDGKTYNMMGIEVENIE
jgi:hypothetical protein